MIYIRRCRFDPKRFELRKRAGSRTSPRDTVAVPKTLSFEAAAILCRRMNGE